MKKFVWAVVGIIALQFIQNYAFTLLPRVGVNFIFELFTPENIHLIYRYFFIALGIVFIRGALAYGSTYSLSVVSESSINNLRNRFFQKLICLPLNYYKRNKTGNFISMTIDDMEKIRINLYEGIIRIISHVAYVVLVIVKLLLLNSLLTVISLSVIPVLYVLFKILGTRLRITSRKLQQNVAHISTNLHETLTAVDVVKAFAKEDYEIERFGKTAGKYKKTVLKLKVLANLVKPLNEFVIYFFAFILIGIAGLFIVRGGWTVKGLSEYMLLLGILFNPISNIPKTLTSFKVVSASVDRIFSVAGTENTIREIERPVEKKIEGRVRFENVSFAYDKERILKNIDFEVEKGEIVALVGSSGAGKTTIVNLIPRFYDPTDGRVEIDGTDVRNYSIRCLRSQIGIVSQNVLLFNDTIYENIRYSKRDASKEEIIEASRKAHAFEFISSLPKGFETVVGEKGTRLSGGEKQRIAIARTVLINPQVLILDEATSALDSESEHYIQVALNELMKGKTSVVIAHRLSTITHATKVLIIENGEIIETGTHEELLQISRTYKRLYELQYFR